MRTLGIALSLAVVGGCGGMDWDADDNRVGYTQGAGAETAAAHVDPVSGEQVTADSPWRAEYEGKTYYFSDRDSYETFMGNPSQYAQEGQAEVR